MTALAPRRRAIFNRRGHSLLTRRGNLKWAAALLIAAVAFTAGFTVGVRSETSAVGTATFAAVD